LGTRGVRAPRKKSPHRGGQRRGHGARVRGIGRRRQRAVRQQLCDLRRDQERAAQPRHRGAVPNPSEHAAAHPRRVRRAGPGADGYRKDAGVLPAHDREPAKVVAAAGPWAPPARGHPRADPRAGQAGRQRDRVDDEKVPRRHRVRRHIDPGAALCAAQRRRLCGWHARARHRPDQPPEPAPGQRRVYLPGRGGPDAGHWLQGRHGKGAAGGQAAARRRLVPDAAVLGDRARVGQPGRARLYAGRPQKDRPDRVAKAQDQRDDHVHGHHDAVEDAPRRRGRPGRGARQGRAQHHLHRDKVGRQQAGHVVQVLRRRAGAARRHCAGAARADAAGLPQRHRP
ncbi:hypothetical protein IWQ57_006825, partial [Coemansia nantahalensis]